jgi:heat shock protein HslJ
VTENTNGKTETAKTETTEGASLEFLFKKLDQGIEFYAIGNEPSWGLDMDFEGRYTFKTMDFNFTCPPGEGHSSIEDNVTMFRGKTGSGEIIITLLKTPCTDNMSGEKFPYTAEVQLKKAGETDFTVYKGCGRYIFDQRIHDIWVLEKMNGESVSRKKDGMDLPRLEINTTDNMAMGNTGCNNFNGSANVMGYKLELGPLGVTRKYCEGAEYESGFLKVMQPGTFNYKIENGKLSLKKEGKDLLVFKKVD